MQFLSNTLDDLYELITVKCVSFSLFKIINFMMVMLVHCFKFGVCVVGVGVHNDFYFIDCQMLNETWSRLEYALYMRRIPQIFG